MLPGQLPQEDEGHGQMDQEGAAGDGGGEGQGRGKTTSTGAIGAIYALSLVFGKGIDGIFLCI